MTNLHSLLTIILLVSFIGAPSAYQMVKPGCPDKCGDVEIPYPFGFLEGCYALNRTFRLVCDNSSGTGVPLLYNLTGNTQVMSIDLEDHSLRISSNVAYQCYNDGNPIPNPNINSSILGVSSGAGGLRFNMSATKNMLVGIGCDTVATAVNNVITGGMTGAVGCITSCSSIQDAVSGPCPGGQGCCASTIFYAMDTSSVTAGSTSNYTHLRSQGKNDCSAAFITEVNNGSYDFSADTLTASAEDYEKMRVPVVYDWDIPSFEANCSESMKVSNGSFAFLCSSNSRCFDTVPYEYLCHCLDGFVGNPYLSDGCQDVNECSDDRLNDCETPANCVNTNGGYECECQNGYEGYATKTRPCFATQSATKAITLGLSISMGSILAFVFAGGMYKLLQRRKEIKERETNFDKNGGKLLDKRLLTSDSGIGGTKIFSKAELEKATDNFNDNRILGRGGQGTVYKGMMPDGSIVAIKKSKNSDDENHDTSIDQFINEVVIMSNINHRNVVKLYGCCLETKVPLLVYEFVPNGTLEQHIHNPTTEFHITWKMRFQIALDSAAALAYLHSSSDTPTYHRDIKSSNILLDEKYKAKVSDFGISKNFSVDQTHVTTAIQGTYGYLDPEYYQLGQFTDKSDVYSFGAVLLELLTSKRPISTNKAYQSQSLVSVFLQLMVSRSDELYNILDMEVLQECPRKDTETLVKLTKRCLSMHGMERPTMKEVAMTLEMIKARNGPIPKNMNREGECVVKREEYGWSDEQTLISMVDEGPFASSSSTTFNSLL